MWSAGVAREIRRFKPVPRWERLVLDRNERLNDAYRGRRCFVIGNGPSLEKTNIDSLGNDVTIVMNHFNLHPALDAWEPTIHCAAEPGTFYKGQAGLDYLSELLRGYSSATHVFPIDLKRVVEQTGLVPSERLAFVRQDGRLAADFHDLDLTRAVPAAHDTSILAVSIAIALGCSPIILLGLDYDWLVRGPMSHFYGEAREPLALTSAALPYDQLPYLDRITLTAPRWRAHLALRRIAERRGQVVVNASPGTYLDVYPAVTFGEVIGAAPAGIKGRGSG
jgi:hypothetical protein